MSDTPTVENSGTLHPGPQPGNGSPKTGLSANTLRWTARDQYASAAMQSLLSTTRADTVANRVDQIAQEAYRIADAMLRNA